MWGRRREPWKPSVRLGEQALAAGDYESALRSLTAAMQVLADDASASRHDIASVLVLRARAHRLAGQLVEAGRIASSAYEAARGGDATLIAMSAAELSYALLKQGDHRLARTRIEEVLAASEPRADAAHVAVLLDTLARVLIEQHDLPAAMQALDRALEIRERLFRKTGDPAIVISLSLRGTLLIEQGEPIKARDDLDKALSICQRGLGFQHPMVGVILAGLARLHRDARELGRACELLRAALAILQMNLGAEHPYVADTLVALGGALADRGSLEEAVTALEAALAIQQKAFGGDGRLAGVTTHRELSRVLLAQGDLRGVVDHLQQALATLRRIYGRDDHPDFRQVADDLARWQWLQRKSQQPIGHT